MAPSKGGGEERRKNNVERSIQSFLLSARMVIGIFKSEMKMAAASAHATFWAR